MQSMTGYGKAELNLFNSNFIVEIKSLNSKQIDINIKVPSSYKDKEIEIRKTLSKKLSRGKIELCIWKEKTKSSSNYKINTETLKNYHKEILDLSNILNLSNKLLNSSDIIPALLKMPDSVIKEKELAKRSEWKKINDCIKIAMTNLLEFRKQEGVSLEKDIYSRIHKLKKYLSQLSPISKMRIKNVKNNLSEKLIKLKSKNIDENRLEQELIFYLEKQDITEETVRLNAHLDYFLKTIKLKSPNGKKLIFISQEIGREINTIGAKSYNAKMQKIVVEMKDELEKVKEQLLNVL